SLCAATALSRIGATSTVRAGAADAGAADDDALDDDGAVDDGAADDGVLAAGPPGTVAPGAAPPLAGVAAAWPKIPLMIFPKTLIDCSHDYEIV
ncbi:MAG TPA: hypothetical protein VEQ16_10140, partial [Acidocella sp.]|nr:hypothetical protein [Acidocella sp.]